MKQIDIQSLRLFAAKIRIKTLEQMAQLGEGHVGGCMSIADLLAVLYGYEMNYDPKNPKMSMRDRLVLSKGHSGPALYATLAMQDFLPLEELNTLNKPHTRLPSHCDRYLTPGIDMTTGSLGQGLSAAVGMHLANRLEGRKCYIYVILGDGECQEGQVWEAAMYAAHQNLEKLIVLVDWNGQQVDGKVNDICDLKDLKMKWASFGFDTQQVDGHDIEELINTIDRAKGRKGKPHAILMKTIKGKDCSFAQGRDNHYMKISQNQAKEAIRNLELQIKHLQGDKI